MFNLYTDTTNLARAFLLPRSRGRVGVPKEGWVHQARTQDRNPRETWQVLIDMVTVREAHGQQLPQGMLSYVAFGEQNQMRVFCLLPLRTRSTLTERLLAVGF